MEPVRVIIFGATGMVGEGVLDVALRHPDVASVLVIGRRSCDRQHPKLREIIRKDLFDLSAIEAELRGWNACYFCLGVSSIGMKEPEYTRVTYDLTMAAGRTLSRLNPGMTMCYVSGHGTDSTERGKSMWARVKGKTENDLMKLPFKAVFAFRPGFIKPVPGQRHAFRAAKILGAAYPLWHFLVPGFICTLENLGRAMIRVATHGYTDKVIDNVDIATLGEQR